MSPGRRLAEVRTGVADVIAPEVDAAATALDDPGRRLAGVRIGVAGVVSSSSKSTIAAGVAGVIALEVDTAASRLAGG